MVARPYTPLAFANEFICKATGIGVEHMKLQKLAYMCYGWWLVAHDQPIMNEEPQVWQHGPAFKSLYFVLNTFGHVRITEPQSRLYNTPPERIDQNDGEVHDLVDWVWMKYGGRSPFYLSDLTHRKGSPWYQTAERFDFRVPKNTPIPADTIKAHFRSIAEERGFTAGLAAAN